MRNRMYGGVRGRKTKVGRKLLRFPPTRLVCRARLKSLFNGAKFDIFLRFNNIFFTLVPLLRGGANYLRKSFVEGIIVATFDAQIIKDNIKL